MKSFFNKLICVGFLFTSASWGYAQCQAGFTWTQSANNTISFTNTSVPANGLSYIWDFGDQYLSPMQNPVHYFPITGSYQVCLTIIDSLSNCMNTFCDSVQVTGLNSCLADFSYWVAWNQTVNFTNNSLPQSSSMTYFWTFGDNQTSTAFSPNHYYAQPGTYQVCLIINDSATNCTSSMCDVVTISQQSSCVAGFTWTYTGNNTISITNTSSPITTSSYCYWNYGDNSPIDMQMSSTFTYTYGAPGTYELCLLLTDTAGSCQSVYCDSIVIPGANTCQASFTFTASNGTVNFTNTSTPSNTMTYWNFGDSQTSYQSNPSHTYANSGNYIVCLTIYDSLSMCQSTFCDTINVTISGIADHYAQPEWKLFPVPATAELHIEGGRELSGAEYTIIDITGRAIRDERIETNTINISSLENGVYFLRIKTSNGCISSRRFIKE